jgi:hypothetical protein
MAGQKQTAASSTKTKLMSVGSNHNLAKIDN